MNFLGIMANIKPIGPDEWQQVVDEHNQLYGEMNRSVDSLRRKFASLHRKKVPTGDPHCPEEVKLAKRVKYSIGNKADLGDAEEEMNIHDGSLSGGGLAGNGDDLDNDEDDLP